MQIIYLIECQRRSILSIDFWRTHIVYLDMILFQAYRTNVKLVCQAGNYLWSDILSRF
jgi:hypothetical protein